MTAAPRSRLSRQWRVLAAVLIFAVPGPVAAQDDAAATAPPAEAVQPQVTAELTPDTAVVGQPLVLRIKVLVPTWLPDPPAFPALDVPNVIVRLPEGASGPISDSVGGETWSGVSRAYRLYPMVPGDVSLPAQTITVTYADPDTSAPVTFEASLDPVRFTATVPEDAAGLDPLILASGLTLEQTIDGADGPLGEGDAASRSVTAKISGTSALFIPSLIPPVKSEAVRAYPKDPAIAETSDRGVLSGSRTETVSYVAQYGGSVELPPISINWFNTETGSMETAQLEGVTLDVDAPGPPVAARFTPRQIALLIGGVILLLLVAQGLRLYALPPLRRLRDRRKTAWEASEGYAARGVRQAIGRKDLSATHCALAIWSDRCPGHDAPDLESALAGIGAGRYGDMPDGGGDWSAVSAAFQAERQRRLAGASHGAEAVPPLNPS
ncbi:hypothetical protein AB0T83_02410 [Fluviibacterium sp. DFM31]|uniref:Protein BatD n=1 Tax=Meridianimarinicoccus marinus TaxID=3231483 RepID=A0ABV3L281_9RHOB